MSHANDRRVSAAVSSFISSESIGSSFQFAFSKFAVISIGDVHYGMAKFSPRHSANVSN